MEKKFLRASQSNKKPAQARLALEHKENDGVFTCDSLEGWAETATFVVYEADSNGDPIAGTETDWLGNVDGNTIRIIRRTSGEDRDYPVNTVVMALETAEGRNMLVEGLLGSLNEDGSLKSESIDASKLDASKIDASKLDASKIDSSKLDASKIQAGNLEFPVNSIPMTALKGASGDDSQSKIYTDAEIAKLKSRIDTAIEGLDPVAKSGDYRDLKNKPLDRKIARAVIGSSTAGYSPSEVDYLCNGENDQNIINEAISSLPENGGEIIILDGEYNITAPVIIENKKNVRLNGAGHSTHLRRMWNSTTAQGIVEIKNSPNTTIVNMLIDNNEGAFPGDNNKDLNADEVSSDTLNTGENSGGSGDFLSDKGVEEIRKYAEKYAPESDVIKRGLLRKGGFKETGKIITIGLEAGSGVDIVVTPGDISQKISEALEALREGGGTLLFKEGTYYSASGSITPTNYQGTSNLCIKGEKDKKVALQKLSVPVHTKFLKLENVEIHTNGSATFHCDSFEMINSRIKSYSSVHFYGSQVLIDKSGIDRPIVFSGCGNVVLKNSSFSNTVEFSGSDSTYRRGLKNARNISIENNEFEERGRIVFNKNYGISYSNISIRNNSFSTLNFNDDRSAHCLNAIKDSYMNSVFVNAFIQYGGNSSPEDRSSAIDARLVVEDNIFNIGANCAIAIASNVELVFSKNKIKPASPGVGGVGKIYNCRAFFNDNYMEAEYGLGIERCEFFAKRNVLLTNMKSIGIIESYKVFMHRNLINTHSDYAAVEFSKSITAYMSSIILCTANIVCGGTVYVSSETKSGYRAKGLVVFKSNAFVGRTMSPSDDSFISLSNITKDDVDFVLLNNFYTYERVSSNPGELQMVDNVKMEPSSGIPAAPSLIDLGDLAPRPSSFAKLREAISKNSAEKIFPIGTMFYVPRVKNGLVVDRFLFTLVHYGLVTTANGEKKSGAVLASLNNTLHPMEVDKAEQNNPNSDRRSYGNNHYSLSNIHQWLNTDKPANEWFQKTHEYDEPPSYFNEDGFLVGLPQDFLENIADVKISTRLAGTDGGAEEETICKVFLPSRENLGYARRSDNAYADDNAEGGVWDFFNISKEKNRSWYKRLKTTKWDGSVRTNLDIATRSCRKGNSCAMVCSKNSGGFGTDTSVASSMSFEQGTPYGNVRCSGSSNIAPCVVVVGD